MAITVRFVLLLVSVVVLAVAALWTPPAPPRLNLVAAGLTFFAAAWLFPG